MKKLLLFLFLSFALMQSVTLQAQAIFKEQNLSTFNTDNLSDADL
jgi:hypothetical protein